MWQALLPVGRRLSKGCILTALPAHWNLVPNCVSSKESHHDSYVINKFYVHSYFYSDALVRQEDGCNDKKAYMRLTVLLHISMVHASVQLVTDSFCLFFNFNTKQDRHACSLSHGDAYMCPRTVSLLIQVVVYRMFGALSFFVTEIYTHVHLSVNKWCIVGYGAGACGICATVMNLRNISENLVKIRSFRAFINILKMSAFAQASVS